MLHLPSCGICCAIRRLQAPKAKATKPAAGKTIEETYQKLSQVRVLRCLSGASHC